MASEKDIIKSLEISDDGEFKQAVSLSKNLIEQNVLRVKIISQQLEGIEFSFDETRLVAIIKKSPLDVKRYKDIFENEISEMFSAAISKKMKSWLNFKIQESGEKLDDGTDTASIKQLFENRYSTVKEALINKSFEDTRLLRKVTKNKLFFGFNWEINKKYFDGDNSGKSKEIELPAFATLQFLFNDKEFSPYFGLSRYGIKPVVKSDVEILVDFNEKDIDNFIKDLTEIKKKLEMLSKKGI